MTGRDGMGWGLEGGGGGGLIGRGSYEALYRNNHARPLENMVKEKDWPRVGSQSTA